MAEVIILKVFAVIVIGIVVIVVGWTDTMVSVGVVNVNIVVKIIVIGADHLLSRRLEAIGISPSKSWGNKARLLKLANLGQGWWMFHHRLGFGLLFGSKRRLVGHGILYLSLESRHFTFLRGHKWLPVVSTLRF